MARKKQQAAKIHSPSARTAGAARGVRFIRELVEVMVLALIMALVINMFVVKMFYIPSSSMEDTLLINDKLIVNRTVYLLKQPRSGDIIVFKSPKDPEYDYVKRCVAVGGDTVQMRDRKLYVNGRRFVEPPGVKYQSDRSYLRNLLDNYGPVEVPEDCLFMMGDNRYNSQDSRFWGPLPLEFVKGKATAIYWPLDRITLLR